MASQWLKARQTKYAAYATIYILIVVAAIVVANVLADRYNKSFDATSNKRYSLSDQSAKIVKGLKQDATITYYNQSTRFNDGKDLLDQYANLSSRVHVQYVDPDKNPQAARAANIRNFGTAIVEIGAKKEEAKSMTEEGITGAFIRDLKSTTRTICFVAGSGEHQIDSSEPDGLSEFKDVLSKDNYEAKTVDLLQGRSASGLHDPRRRRPRATTSNPKSTPSRNMSRMADESCSCWIPPLKLGRDETADNDASTNLIAGWGADAAKRSDSRHE